MLLRALTVGFEGSTFQADLQHVSSKDLCYPRSRALWALESLDGDIINATVDNELISLDWPVGKRISFESASMFTT